MSLKITNSYGRTCTKLCQSKFRSNDGTVFLEKPKKRCQKYVFSKYTFDKSLVRKFCPLDRCSSFVYRYSNYIYPRNTKSIRTNRMIRILSRKLDSSNVKAYGLYGNINIKCGYRTNISPFGLSLSSSIHHQPMNLIMNKNDNNSAYININKSKILLARRFSSQIPATERITESIDDSMNEILNEESSTPKTQYSSTLRAFQDFLNNEPFKADSKKLYQIFYKLIRNKIQIPAETTILYVKYLRTRRETGSVLEVVSAFLKQHTEEDGSIKKSSREYCQEFVCTVLLIFVKRGQHIFALNLWSELGKQGAFVTTTDTLHRVLKELSDSRSLDINWDFVEKIHSLAVANNSNQSAIHYTYLFRLLRQNLAANSASIKYDQSMTTLQQLLNRGQSLLEEYNALSLYKQSEQSELLISNGSEEDLINGRLNVYSSFLRFQTLAYQIQHENFKCNNGQSPQIIILSDICSTFDKILEMLTIRKKFPPMERVKLMTSMTSDTAETDSIYVDLDSTIENINSFFKFIFKNGRCEEGLQYLIKYLDLVCLDKTTNGNFDHGDSAYFILASIIRCATYNRFIKIPHASTDGKVTILKYQDLDQLEALAKQLLSYANTYNIHITPVFYGGWIAGMLRPDYSPISRKFPMSSSSAYVYKYTEKYRVPTTFFIQSSTSSSSSTIYGKGKNDYVAAMADQFPRFDWREVVDRAYRVVDTFPENSIKRKNNVSKLLPEQIIHLLCRFESKEPLHRAAAMLKENKYQKFNLSCYTNILYTSMLVNDYETFTEVMRAGDLVFHESQGYSKYTYFRSKIFPLCRWNKGFEAWRMVNSVSSSLIKHDDQLYSWLLKSLYFSNPTNADEWNLILNPGKLTRSIVQRMIADEHSLKLNHVIGLIHLFGKAGAIVRTSRENAASMDSEHDQSLSAETTSKSASDNITYESTEINETETKVQSEEEEKLEREFMDPTVVESMNVQDILNDMHVFVKSICFNPKSSDTPLDRFIIKPLAYNHEIASAIVKVYCQCGHIDKAITIAKSVESLFGIKHNVKGKVYKHNAFVPVFYSLCLNGNISRAEMLLTEIINTSIYFHRPLLDILVKYHLKFEDPASALDRMEEVYNQYKSLIKPTDFLIEILEASLVKSDEFEANRVVTFIRQRFSLEARIKGKYVKRVFNYKAANANGSHTSNSNNYDDFNTRERGKISSSPIDSHRLKNDSVDHDASEYINDNGNDSYKNNDYSDINTDSFLSSDESEQYEKVYENVEYGAFTEEGLKKLFNKYGVQLLPPGGQHSFG